MKQYKNQSRLIAMQIALVFSISFSFLNAQDISMQKKSRGMTAYPFPAKVMQPNGDQIILMRKGDGMINWYKTKDGYSVLKDKNGVYVYATSDGKGGMVPSQNSVSSFTSSIPPGLENDLQFSSEQIASASKIYFGESASKSNPTPFPAKGTNNVLVILAEFPDKPAVTTPAGFENLMNEPGYLGIGSFRDYYLDISYNNLTLNSTVTAWVQVSQNMSYYGGNDEFGYDLAPDELVREAVDLVEASGFDFSQFDNDNDGYVDEIAVFHAGYGEEYGDGADTCIWSHAYHLGEHSVVHDGVILDNYIISSELYGSSGDEIAPIGTVVHEFAHSLGIPDLYDVDQEGSGGYAFDLNFWDLLAVGAWNLDGNSPAGINAWLKEYIGWMTIPEINATGTYTLNNLYENQEAYKINTGTYDEFFILENRQWYGFDYDIPGYGMLIYHVDLNYPGWQYGNVNVDPTHQGFDIEEADNIRDSLTIDGDTYPGWDTVTSFSSLTSPGNHTWNGVASPFIIENIAESDSVITFDFINTAFENAPALWTVDPGAFTDTGRIVAMVHVATDTASSGFLSAFVGSECRGIAPVIFYPENNNYIFDLDVYSNTISGETMTFNYYDPALDSVFDILEYIEFVSDSIAGDMASPLELHTPTFYNRTINPGWNWFSLNVQNNDMTVGTILPLCTTFGDYVKTQTQSSTYYGSYGWYGSLPTLNTEDLYLVDVTEACDIDYSGIAIDPASNPINLSPGWNWVAYTPQVSIPVSEALTSLNPTLLDYIKTQTSSATYYGSSYGWYGSLEVMTPGNGYMFKLENGGVLEYPVKSSAKKAVKREEEINSSVVFDLHNFEFNATLTASVQMSGNAVASEEDILFAFVGNECRGVVKGKYFEPLEEVLFPLMVYSNLSSEDILTFKYYNAASDQLLRCFEDVVFEKNMVMGDAFDPKVINVDEAISNVDLDLLSNSALHVYPNPFKDRLAINYTLPESSVVKLEVFDVFGRMVERVVENELSRGTYTSYWEPGMVESGSYIVKLTTDQTQIVKHINFMK